ncbi:hypothetical protein B0J13DRAFT_571684 [Dactylonectria estremocensis]|uniref:Zn(2)-C6 fungal-type domain-containing protein n=1 Tax=Dactylonectria estremocensis TaxID=1079267 RepID=A0A9P9DCQ9_9HYPO|nr:hypothetical protein B0J13DRAFT_571684 [Dactylonectria estremocensis]
MMPPSPKSTLLRSCDRCHALKEKCQQPQGAVACARCDRLGFECLNRRPTKKSGRPSRFAKLKQSTASSPLSDASEGDSGKDNKALYAVNPASIGRPVIPRCLPSVNNLTSADHRLVQQMLLSDSGADYFLLGPSFAQNHIELLVSHFVTSQSVLKDAFLAVACTLQEQSDVINTESTTIRSGYIHACSALKQLREYQVQSKHGVSECLALGAMILSFAHCSTSTDAPAIASRTLALIKEPYETKTDFSHEDLVFMSCIILPEIFECLIHGSVPTVRYRPVKGSEKHVDRYIGLFSPLLPHLYDICELSNAMSCGDNQDMCEIISALELIDQQITAWRPDIPLDFTARFTAVEVSHMLCQVQVMRLGCSLIIHRLKFPFGLNNNPAVALAMSILTQLDLTRAATNKRILSTSIPLVAACFELQTASDRKMWHARLPELIGYSPGFAGDLQNLISSFWKARDAVDCLSWSNVGHVMALTRDLDT